MKIINFYKLFSSENSLSAMALICNKIFESGEKVVIYLENEEEIKTLDERLWSFSQSEFIPHMTETSEEFSEFQDEVPILLSNNFENVINAENLIILKRIESLEGFEKFNKIFFLFEGEDVESLKKAREFWKQISALKNDFQAKFYEQSEEKKWSLKA
jgi:DNA polymerase-3 subunit chi